MFAAGMTVIVDVAVLFPGFGSGLVAAALTTAVFVIGPGVDGSSDRQRERRGRAVGERARVAGDDVVPLHAPAGVDDCSVVPGGRVSVTVTDVAVFGPPFVTTIV